MVVSCGDETKPSNPGSAGPSTQTPEQDLETAFSMGLGPEATAIAEALEAGLTPAEFEHISNLDWRNTPGDAALLDATFVKALLIAGDVLVARGAEVAERKTTSVGVGFADTSGGCAAPSCPDCSVTLKESMAHVSKAFEAIDPGKTAVGAVTCVQAQFWATAAWKPGEGSKICGEVLGFHFKKLSELVDAIGCAIPGFTPKSVVTQQRVAQLNGSLNSCGKGGSGGAGGSAGAGASGNAGAGGAKCLEPGAVCAGAKLICDGTPYPFETCCSGTARCSGGLYRCDLPGLRARRVRPVQGGNAPSPSRGFLTGNMCSSAP